jgi:hypothetical protein
MIELMHSGKPKCLNRKMKSLMINPTHDLKIDAYSDASFAELCFYNHKNQNDPIYVRSRIGYVINVAECPVPWKSQLQT